MPEGPILIRDHGLDYAVDLAEGQKTGLYLDQRENRAAVAGYFAGAACSTCSATPAGSAWRPWPPAEAREVLGIDSSAKAIAVAQENARHNGLEHVRFESGDGFAVRQSLRAAGERFDAIVLDPPKFARSQRAIDEALRAIIF